MYDHGGGDLPEVVFPFEFHYFGFEPFVLKIEVIGLFEVIKPFGLDSSVFLVLELVLDHADSFPQINFLLLAILEHGLVLPLHPG